MPSSTTEDTLLHRAGNPLAVQECQFLERFWADDAIEEEFSRTFYFGQPESPAIRQLIAGEEDFYRRHKRGNLERLEGMADFIAARIPAGSRVLDIGCGLGQLAYYLEQRGLKLSGVDLNERSLGFGRRILSDLESRVEIQEGDALDLPFADESFDAVVSCDVIEHVPEQARFLSESFRVTRPGGTLILHTDNDRRVQLGVWFRRLTCGFKGHNPFHWNHAWAGLEGGHCALTTPSALSAVTRHAGYEDVAVELRGSSVPLLRGWLAEKFALRAHRPAS